MFFRFTILILTVFEVHQNTCSNVLKSLIGRHEIGLKIEQIYKAIIYQTQGWDGKGYLHFLQQAGNKVEDS